ncbi:extracellular solute-binding protein [Deinococcus sonorensis]|uniref:Extracellular solute-binding protein n=2 Tax=Deinococcus sonorensis TaxID=309891 RepID=A0AAU7UCD6_9DEIO
MKRVLLSLSLLLSTASAAPVTLNALFMKQAAYSEANIKDMTKAFEAKNPNIKVNLEFVPYEGLHDKIVSSASAGTNGYDVVLFDVIWPTEFAKNSFLVDVTNRIPAADNARVFSGAWTTVTAGGKRYGMPWILDTKYLYYNKAILKKAGIAAPPRTWAELQQQAATIKAKGLVEYPIVWSWSQAEALICDYTTLISAFGGQFYAGGKPVFNTGGGLKALQYMTDSLKSGVSNPNSKEYLEEDVRKVFSDGKAAFALNWTYMYNMANDPKQSKVAGQVGIVPAPGVAGVSQVSAMNGSMGLGIPTGSAHKDEAWRFIQYLTSAPVQEQFAQLSLPIWKASYSKPAVTKGQEALVKAAGTSLNVMFPRPTIAQYPQLSTVLQTALQKALLGSQTPAQALDVGGPDRQPLPVMTARRGNAPAARFQGWSFLLPLLVILACVIGYPLVRTVYLSFTDASLNALGIPPQWLGVANYQGALTSPEFLATLWNSTTFTVVSVALETVLGVLVALLLNQRFRGRTLARALLILPWAIPTIVNATMWRWIYNPEYGALNALLTQTGLIGGYRSWLGEPSSAMLMVILADVWKNYPLVAMIALAALQGVPAEIHEAASLDGASAWVRFWRLTLPAILGPLSVAVVLRTIEAFKVFDIIYVMTRGGPADATKTASFSVYQEAFTYLQAGSGAAYANVMVLISAVLIAGYLLLMRRQGSGSGPA